MEDSAVPKELQESLQSSIESALLTRRPILTHLNADTTWVLQLPYPQNLNHWEQRSRFNIVFDPWLQGPQTDVASWFSKQWHASDSSVQNVGELQVLLSDVNELDLSLRLKSAKRKSSLAAEKIRKSYIDAVVISHEFTDHCNKATLFEFEPETPIFATKSAANLIMSWNYFKTVQEVPSFNEENPDWRKGSIAPLPPWIGISKIVSKTDSSYLHSAVLVAFSLSSNLHQNSEEKDFQGEAIIYTPHGVYPEGLRHLSSAKPHLTKLALLHGLHDIALGPFIQLNLGAHNGLQVQKVCKAKYWISTHDEVKRGTGLVSAFLRRKVISLNEAIEQEREEKGNVSNNSEKFDIRSVIFADLKNGESILLS